MTNVEALKEVYLALGGSEENFNATTNDEAIALIATVASGGSGGGGGMTVIELDASNPDAPPRIPNGANVTALITSGTPVVFYVPSVGENPYMYFYPGTLNGSNLYIFAIIGGSTPSVSAMKFTYNSETDIWELGV